MFGALSGLPNSFGSFANLTMPQLAAASPTYNIDRIEVSAPVYVSERLSDDDIREHARTIGAISADFIREGFTKRGVGRTASLF